MELDLKAQFIQSIEILRSKPPQLITFSMTGAAAIVDVRREKIVLTVMDVTIGNEPRPREYAVWTENDTYSDLKDKVVPWKMKTIIGIAILVENEMM